jgi:Calcineurin-like phosphoesterase
MPDPDRLLPTIRRAVQAFRSTPGRRGRVVRLQDAAEVVAAGDLHGNLDNFRLLLQTADLGRKSQRHLVLQELIHGPYRYPHGGDKSHQLLDLVAALKCQYPRQVHLLLGNHELSQWTNRRIAKEEGELIGLFWQGVQTAYGERADEVYAAYLELFAVAPLVVRTANRVFLSHSLPTGVRLPTFAPALLEQDEVEQRELQPGGSVYSLLWGRDTSEANVTTFLRVVDADLLVTGHIPCPNGYEVPNRRQLLLDAQGDPGCYCLFPADRPLTHAELVAGVGAL